MLYLDFSFSLYNTFELGLEGVDYDVEFSDLHRVLSTEYRPNISHVEASSSKLFPLTTKRKSKGGSKRTFYLGLRPRSELTSTTASGSSVPPQSDSSELITSELKSSHLEVSRILSSDGLLVHGPDTVANFHSAVCLQSYGSWHLTSLNCVLVQTEMLIVIMTQRMHW